MAESTNSRRTLVIVLIAVLALVACLAVAATTSFLFFMPVREEITEIPQPEDATAPETAPSEPTGTGIEWESETVAGLLPASSAGWVTHMTGARVTTVLKRPVIVVSTDIGPEQADLADEFATGLSSFVGSQVDGGPYTYYVQILSSEGDIIGSVAATDARWALDAPAAPSDAAGLEAWLARVYGSGSEEPEAWASRIKTVEAPANGTSIVVRTDLDPASAEDLRFAQTIIDAVNSSGATFAPGIRIVFADGEFAWESMLDGIDPYGP